MEGARTAFSERGFHGARLEDICAAAGLTRGAFYSGFKSKEDLFFALYDHMIVDVRTLMANLLDSVDQAETDPIQTLVSRLATQYPLGREWYLLNAEFTLFAIRDEQAALRLAERRRVLRDSIVQMITAALAKSRRTLDVDPDLFARLLIGIADAGLGQSLLEPDRLNNVTFIDVFLPKLMKSFSTPAVDRGAVSSNGGPSGS